MRKKIFLITHFGKSHLRFGIWIPWLYNPIKVMIWSISVIEELLTSVTGVNLGTVKSINKNRNTHSLKKKKKKKKKNHIYSFKTKRIYTPYIDPK